MNTITNMVIKYCTLASNANLDMFPENSLSNFTNIFPFPVKPKHGHTLYVRLRAIAISPTLINPGDPFARTIQIRIEELQALLTNSSFEKCLKRLSFPPGIVLEHYAFLEFDNTEFLPILFASLTQLSILITDARGRQLRLADGPPTLLCIEFSEMEVSGQFSLACVSHLPEERETYPDNTLNKFIIGLPNELELQGYEVAVTSVSFPSDMIVRLPPMFFSFKVQPDDYEVTVPFNLFEYTDSRALLNDVVQKVNEALPINEYIRAKVERDPRSANYEMLQICGRLTGTGRSVLMTVSPEFMRVIGRPFQEHTLSADECVTLGKINLKGALPSQIGMLYCSCIDSNILGNRLFQLLQIVPIIRDRYVYEPQHLLFHPVIARPFDNIEFRLTQPDGTDHTYESPSGGSMIVSLLFRPVMDPFAQRPVIRRTQTLPHQQSVSGRGAGAGGDDGEPPPCPALQQQEEEEERLRERIILIPQGFGGGVVTSATSMRHVPTLNDHRQWYNEWLEQQRGIVEEPPSDQEEGEDEGGPPPLSPTPTLPALPAPPPPPLALPAPPPQYPIIPAHGGQAVPSGGGLQQQQQQIATVSIDQQREWYMKWLQEQHDQQLRHEQEAARRRDEDDMDISDRLPFVNLDH